MCEFVRDGTGITLNDEIYNAAVGAGCAETSMMKTRGDVYDDDGDDDDDDDDENNNKYLFGSYF